MTNDLRGAAMTRDKTIALFLQGREAWNAWAEQMLAERKALEEAGEWHVDSYVFPLNGKNEKTENWINRAYVDFNGCRVIEKNSEAATSEGETHDTGNNKPDLLVEIAGGEFDCSGFLFPGYTGFDQTAFHIPAAFECAVFNEEAHFGKVQFHADAWFAMVQFWGDASFYGARFNALTHFFSAQFRRGADFRGAQLNAPNFERAQFRGEAHFNRARFSRALTGGSEFDVARFTWAEFQTLAEFERAQFQVPARFDSARFMAAVRFRSAVFGTATMPRKVCFTGIKADGAFDMTGARFSKVPSFNQADFAQAPDLDNVTYPISGFWRRGNRGDIPRYRHLRRIALGGHNQDAEAMAFKGETRAKRFTEHRWRHLALYAGMFYDAVSDFGRSIVRPLLVWLISIPIFALIYLWHAGKLSQLVGACEGAAYWGKALLFALKNALLIVSWDFAQINSAYSCLYGVGLQGSLNAVPAGNAVIQGVQSVFSAVVLFLLLLGVRNQFKIK